jgi:murein DD-endopeptidase MepM/ murein hydrolase activator NlpD
MPEGTPIHAARAGIIMDVANDNFTGGTGPKFEEKANIIRILHEDGTMALYAHLKLESIRYPVGTPVERGQFIAESGNTGYSSGPHLHFAVQRNHGMELRSIPFQFESRDGSPFSPERGMAVGR